MPGHRPAPGPRLEKGLDRAAGLRVRQVEGGFGHEAERGGEEVVAREGGEVVGGQLVQQPPGFLGHPHLDEEHHEAGAPHRRRRVQLEDHADDR